MHALMIAADVADTVSLSPGFLLLANSLRMLVSSFRLG